MNVLILGGSGFVGSNLAARLCGDGHRVVTVSRSPLRTIVGAPGEHEHVDTTLDDLGTLGAYLAACDFLFHLASDTTPGTSALQPTLEGLNNIQPTTKLLESLQTSSGMLLVYVSSGGAVYDSTIEPPYTEGTPCNPKSYHGAAKLAIEHFLQAYTVQTGNPTVVLRPANLYGPGQHAKRQFGIVPTILECVRETRSFTIWGDGSTVRDFLYIGDFLELCTCLIEKREQFKGYRTYNAGTGVGCSISRLCDTIETVTGQSIHRQFLASRDIDMPAVVLDSSQARAELGWLPTTSLEAGIERTWQWFQTASAAKKDR